MSSPESESFGDQVLGEDRDQGDDRRELEEPRDVVERRPVELVLVAVVEVEDLGEHQGHRNPGEHPRCQRHAPDDRGRPARSRRGRRARRRAPAGAGRARRGAGSSRAGGGRRSRPAGTPAAPARGSRPRSVPATRPRAHGADHRRDPSLRRPACRALLSLWSCEYTRPGFLWWPTVRLHPRPHCRRKQPPDRGRPRLPGAAPTGGRSMRSATFLLNKHPYAQQAGDTRLTRLLIELVSESVPVRGLALWSGPPRPAPIDLRTVRKPPVRLARLAARSLASGRSIVHSRYRHRQSWCGPWPTTTPTR